MPLSADQLRQLLTERSDPARLHPAPQEGLTMRIRRARIRRAAVAGLLAVVAAAGVVTGLHLAQDHAPGSGAISGAQFPASFTASDGASYRRVAITSLAEPTQKSATIKLAVGSDPVDVMAACDPATVGLVYVTVNGAGAGGLACPAASQLIGLSVRSGRQADITFTAEPIRGRPSVGANGTWRFAVYEWKPPAVARPAPRVPHLPVSYTGYNTTTGRGKTLLHMTATRSGDWPGDRTATFTVVPRDRNFDISVVCSGAIAGRLQWTMVIDGHPGAPQSCTPWTPGEQPPGNGGLTGRAGVPLTVTFRIVAPSPYTAAAYAQRSASWTIGIYEEGS